MELTTKQFLNTLHCPICKSQIMADGDISPSAIKGYVCASNYYHYNIKLSIDNLFNINFKEESISIENDGLRFWIVKKYYLDSKNISINIFIESIDIEGRKDFKMKDKKYSTSINFFDSQNFDVIKTVNRIKTMLSFQ